MKRLCLLVALISSSLFAQQHMIRFDLDTSSSNISTVDFDYKNDDDGSTTTRTSTLFFNYAYTIDKNMQVGFTYGNQRADNDVVDGNETTIGLDFYYSFKDDFLRANYLGFHLHSVKVNDEYVTAGGDNSTEASSDGDKTTRFIIEYGQRFYLTEMWGASLVFSPAINLSINTTKFDDGTDDQKIHEIIWDLLKIELHY